MVETVVLSETLVRTHETIRHTNLETNGNLYKWKLVLPSQALRLYK